MSTANKLLLLAACTMITCILVWMGIHLMNIGKDIGQDAMSQMNELNNDIKDSGIMKYDENDNINGSEIINLMKEKLGDYEDSETAPIYIKVVVGTTENTYSNGSLISNVRDFTDERYIPPTAVYKGDVIKNDNDVILGVEFTQI
jgi:hypothetical protein